VTKRQKTRITQGSLAFFTTIGVLCAATLILIALAALRPTSYDPPASTVAAWIAEAAQRASAETEAAVADEMRVVFAPVYAAIPAYADFHYSVLGEYIELTEAATGAVAQGVEDRLFPDFDQRYAAALARIDPVFAERFAAALAEISARPEGALPLGDATRAALADAQARMSVTAPLATVAAAGVGKAAAKALSKALLKTLAKTAAKTGLKTGAKAAGIGGGMAAGAGIGSVLGPPGALLGGVIGGVATWIAVDYAVIKIDEVLNRDAFEAELRALIDAERARLTQGVLAALATRAEALDETPNGAPNGRTLQQRADP